MTAVKESVKTLLDRVATVAERDAFHRARAFLDDAAQAEYDEIMERELETRSVHREVTALRSVVRDAPSNKRQEAWQTR